MLLYHATTSEALGEIVRNGFLDHEDHFLTDQRFSGVWFSDRPLDMNEGTKGTELLVVEIPEKVVETYEWKEDGKPYREFLIPADIANSYPVRPVGADD